MSDLIEYQLDNGVAIITMDDGKANALGPDMSAVLSEAMDRAKAEAQALVLFGRAGRFSGGFDLKVINGGDASAREAMVADGAAMLLKLYFHPLPVVIGVNGHAVAAGALLALTGDLRVGAAGEFKIGLNETAIGLSLPPFAIELARDRLEETRLTEATLGARLYAPDEAAEVGYLDHVRPAEELQARVLEFAAKMKALHGDAYAGAKQNLRRNIHERIKVSMAAQA